MKTPFGRRRTVDKPYAIYTNPEGWEYRVLKTYQHPDNERKNPYARWLVAARTPMTGGGTDMGDTYVTTVTIGTNLVLADTGWLEHYGDK